MIDTKKREGDTLQFLNKICLLILLSICWLGGCAPEQRTQASIQTYAMDTIMDLKAEGENAPAALQEAEKEIFRLDNLFSVSKKDSEINRINQHAGSSPVLVSSETAQLLIKAKEINQQTENAFSVTIYPMVDAWGFMKEVKQVPSQEVIEDRLPLVNDDELVVDGLTNQVQLMQPGMAVDLGGIAKGYLSDRVTEIMTQHGVKSAILSLGGNISAIGVRADGKPWQVALQDPLDNQKFVGIIHVRDASVITSGGYQRNFEQDGRIYHHIIDPVTGYPAQSGLLSVTIISHDGARADGLSTALFVMGIARAEDFWQKNDDFEAIFITEDKRVLATEGISEGFTFEGIDSGYTYDIIARR